MRHTRTKQLGRIHKAWKEVPNLPIEVVREALDEMDKTFKWHRWNNKNWIEFNKQVDEWHVGTTIIPIIK